MFAFVLFVYLTLFIVTYRYATSYERNKPDKKFVRCLFDREAGRIGKRNGETRIKPFRVFQSEEISRLARVAAEGSGRKKHYYRLLSYYYSRKMRRIGSE